MKGKRAALFSAFLLAGALPFLQGCWIPLPQETALLVEVLDETGNAVPGYLLRIDAAPIFTGDFGDRRGQVFRSFSVSGLHSVQIDNAMSADPQGGSPYVARATMISGESAPVPATVRNPGQPILVPVEKGSVTKVTVYLADLLAYPKDNQWLTDGLDATPLRAVDGTREFSAGPLPTFWWREDPSTMGTHTPGPRDFTFQLWEDADRDIRYPLGIVSQNSYLTTLPHITPDWQVPWKGLQRAHATRDGSGKVLLWSAQAREGVASSPVYYRVRYAQAPTVVSLYYFYQGAGIPQLIPSQDGQAAYFEVGPGTGIANSTISTFGGRAPASSCSPLPGRKKAVFRSGVHYTFYLEAYDGWGNATVGGAARTVTPSGDAGVTIGWADASSFLATSDRASGGAIRVRIPSATTTPPGVPLTYRLYWAPVGDWRFAPFDERYWRTNLPANATTTIRGLVNGIEYVVGAEPIDDKGDRPAAGATTRLVMVAVNNVGGADTTAPVVANQTVKVRPTGTAGEVRICFNAATDDSLPITYRVYLMSDVGYSAEAQEWIDFTGPSPLVGDPDFDSSVRIGGLAVGSYRFQLSAIDPRGNHQSYAPPFPIDLADPRLSDPPAPGDDVSPPMWGSEDPALLFTSVSWSVAGSPGSVHRLGWKYDYDGFALRRWPRSDGTGGEYVWRLNTGTLSSKLAAFYAYSSYYFRSGDPLDTGAALQMAGLSANVRHKDVFGFLWRRLGGLKSGSESSPAGTVGVMSAYLASATGTPSQYLQRSSAGLLDAMANRSKASSVNNMSIFYPTNADGKVVSSGSTGAFSTFLDVVLTNRAADASALFGLPYFAGQTTGIPPYMSSKRFKLLYNYNFSLLGPTDRLVPDESAPSTGKIIFDGMRATPDVSSYGFPWQDPAW